VTDEAAGTGTVGGAGVEQPPPGADRLFGDRFALAERFAAKLATAGVQRGLIGPAEASRLWTRHLLNSAVIADLFPGNARVVDVGSGAGLPGVVLALRRPDLRVELVEPLQRRVAFLAEAVAELGLADRVVVVRGRAEEPAVRDQVGDAPWVTARAVAPLDRLVRWCLPLLGPGGRLALIKGASVEDEVARHRAALRRLGATEPEIVRCGSDLLGGEVSVVLVGARTSSAHSARSARKGKT
jgi:16S rRNA (guanine527-N7)-methyltransferase